MSKFSKIDTIGILRKDGIIPVFYHQDTELTKKVIRACYDGGFRSFEFTNRGDGAQSVFKELALFVHTECPGMALGIGTVLDAGTATLYIQLGADYVVSPCTVEEVARLCNRRGVLYIPGVGTVTEIVHALEIGCDLVKAFPVGGMGGPSFVKNVHGPLPWANVLCSGAVEPTEENLKEWGRSGVFAVEMGSKLFPKEKIAAEDWKAISDLCRKSLEWFKA